MKFNQEFVKLLKETALQYPHNPEASQLAPVETLFEGVEFGPHRLDIQMTYEYFSSTDKQGWHLSICNSNRTEADRKVVAVLLIQIFGYGSTIEVTAGMPVELQWVRQFIKEEYRKYDVKNKKWAEMV